MRKIKKIATGDLTSIYFVGFFFAFSVAIPTYINSEFLSNFVSPENVGFFYSIAAILSIPAIIYIPKLLKKVGNYQSTLLLLVLNIFVLITLAFSNSILTVIVFVLHLILISTIMLNLDVFLENLTPNKETGGTRGSALTLKNLAWVISPTITGLVLSNGDYWKIYLISAVLILPMFSLLSRAFRNFEDPKYETDSFFKTFNIIKHRENVLRILGSNLILKFFYSWMVIYMPIYLHEYIGFEWSVIGVIFTIMLIPFSLFELPLGKLEDKKYGEKEILILGFIIMGLTTAVLTFLDSTSPITWTILLFLTRTGASMIEISSETYFFKKIDGDDTNLLSFFRIMRPIAYTIGPLIASLLLLFTDINNLFAILGGIVIFFGLAFSLGIKDTK